MLCGTRACACAPPRGLLVPLDGNHPCEATRPHPALGCISSAHGLSCQPGAGRAAASIAGRPHTERVFKRMAVGRLAHTGSATAAQPEPSPRGSSSRRASERDAPPIASGGISSVSSAGQDAARAPEPAERAKRKKGGRAARARARARRRDTTDCHSLARTGSAAPRTVPRKPSRVRYFPQKCT